MGSEMCIRDRDNDMPILVFNLLEEGNIARAAGGEVIGTLVQS